MGKKYYFFPMGFYFSRVFKNCITGKYEEISVNTFHFVKYRVILQQNQYLKHFFLKLTVKRKHLVVFVGIQIYCCISAVCWISVDRIFLVQWYFKCGKVNTYYMKRGMIYIYHPNVVPLYMWVNIQYGHLSCNNKSFNSVFEGNAIICQYQEI
jgi:hypothetical protein